MHAGFWWRNLKEVDHSEDLGVDEIIIIQWNLKGPLMVVQWLRYCATNRKVARSIPDGVIGIFH
jgi:hypothetical protein